MKTLLLSIFSLTLLNCFAQVTRVKDLRMQSHIYQVNGSLLFIADSANSALPDLWVSDGTSDGTHPLKIFGDGMFPEKTVGYNTYVPIVFKNELYFLADSDGSGYSLWKSDATYAGTKLVKSFNGSMTGPYGNSFPFFCVLNDELLFAAGDGVHGVELWKTDGTTSGTVLVKDIASDNNYGSMPSGTTAYNNKVYFSASNETYGVEIWQSDGTEGGTTILKDILPGTDGVTNDGYGESIDPQLIVSGNYLFFAGHKSATVNSVYEYRTDGTANGTLILDTLNERYVPLDYHYPYQYDVNGTLMYIGFKEPGSKQILFKSNGTPETTLPIDNGNGPLPDGSLFAFQNKLYFHGSQNDDADDGLCTSDGNTSSLITSFPQANSSPDILDYVSAGNSFFFRGEMKVFGSTTEWQMVQSNGTANGTVIFSGAYPIYPPAYYNNEIYFCGTDTATANTFSLYKLTPATILSVTELPVSNPVNIFPNPANNTLFISAAFAQADNAQLSVFNVMGQMVYSTPVSPVTSNMQLDVSKWESGMYFCKLQQRETAETIKVFIQH